MNEVAVKICGLREARHVQTALNGGVAYLGFMSFPKSPRHIEPAQARALADMAVGKAKTVSVLVNPDDTLIATVLNDLAPDYIQLHGQEPPDFCAGLTAQGIKVIKAFGISTAADLGPVAEYRDVVDMLLFDAKPPKDATRPGGLGHTFDWTILETYRAPLPWFLSGGLTAANARQAVAATGAKKLDLSSGVETAPGLKDSALIEGFMAALKTDT
jgi:phosphoribosylanthranilate isomerase